MNKNNVKNTELLSIIREHYDSYPFNLDDKDREEGIYERSILGKLMKLQLHEEARIIDAGCGAGAVAGYLARYLDHRVIGIDLSVNSLKLAKTKPGVCVAAADTGALPFRDGEADLVISNGVVHCTAVPRQTFAELARIIKPGGRLYFSVYNRKHPYARIYLYAFPLLMKLKDRPKLKMLSAFVIFPLFYLGYVQLGKLIYCRSFRLLPLSMAWNLLHDQLFVPQLSFHTDKEISAWAAECGFSVLEKGREVLGQTLCFLMAKKGD